MAVNENINYTMFEEYYKKAKTAYAAGNYKEAKKLFLDASNSLLVAAKENSGTTQAQLIERAKKLALLADSIHEQVPSVSTPPAGTPPAASSRPVSAPVSDSRTEEDKPDLDELMDELNALIGLEAVKNQVKKRIDAIRVEQAAQEAGSSRKVSRGSLHMIFSGNPGTGKTTVARLIGKIYAALGVIEDGNKFVETDRSGLIGKYIGHTAQMVQEKVSEALGGILFIDEAYSLYKEGSGSDFGEEAVATLVKCMEDHRDNLVVILAGYTDQMRKFIDNANPGLQSRFRTWITFEDYSVDEMVRIFNMMLDGKGMTLSGDAEKPLRELITRRSAAPNFGNGRGVRNLMEDILEENNMRLAKMLQSGEEPDFATVEKEDIYAVLERD